MELPDDNNQTPGISETELARNAHSMPRMGTRDKQTLSITPIHLLTRFQQGCETNDHNIASNEQNQESFQAIQTLSTQDLRGIGIQHKSYLDTNSLIIEQGNIPLFQREQNALESLKSGKIKKNVHFQNEEIPHNDLEAYRYPIITEKIIQESYPGNRFNGMPKQNIHQQHEQQESNYFYPIMQQNKNSPSNNEDKSTKRLSHSQAIKNTFIDQNTSPAISIDPEGQINATSLHDYIKQNIAVFHKDSYMKGMIPEINVQNTNSKLKDNPFMDPNSNHFPNISIKATGQEEEKQPTKIVFNTESDTHYKGMSGRYYSPKAPMYSALFSATTSLPLGLRHPTTPTTTKGEQQNSIPNAIKRMNQEAIQAERHIINKTSTKSLQELNNIMDQNIDNIHILNDHQLKCQGAIITPFANTEEDAPTPLYVGAFEVQRPNQAKMWVCKPCDAMVFRKSNFKTHHRSDKHTENLKIWSGNKHINFIQKEERNNYHEKYKASLVDLEQAIMSIETMIPLKYRKEATAITSKFFNKYLAKEDGIDLIQDFKESKDPSILEQDQRHWINKKMEALVQKEDPRGYLRTKWKSRAVMIRRTSEQKDEIEPIADLARALFASLIDYEFIPIKYLIILAIMMNRRNRHNYQESAITLSNGFYLDLFINPGSIIGYPEKIDSKENPDIQRLAIKENQEEMIFGEFYPENNEEFQNLFIQEPIMQDIQDQIKYDTYNHQSNPENKEWTLDQESQSTASSSSSSSYSIPSLIIPRNNSTSSYSSSSASIPSLINHPINKITLSNSSSSCSIPALVLHPEENTTNQIQPPPIMEQVTNDQTQGTKRRTTDAIYVTNLKPGITKEEMIKLFANCGGNIKEITKHDFESTKALIKFDNHEAADKAVATLHNSIFCGLTLSVCRAHSAGRTPLDKIKTTVKEEKEQETKEQKFIQQYLNSPNSSYHNDSFEEENITEQPPPNNDTVTLELNHFNSQSLQIVPMMDILILPYSTASFNARIVKHDDRNFEIRKGKVSLTCGPAPYLQIMDGIYPVTESLLTPSARNNSSYTICIPKGRIIQGTSCHIDKYINNKVQNIQGGWPAFHLQSKTFHYLNHTNQTSYDWNGGKYPTEDMNPWMMDVDTQ